MYGGMYEDEKSVLSRLAPLALCLALSLLIHGGAVGALPFALPLVAPKPPPRAEQPKPAPQRAVRVVREKPRPTQFVKTDPDQEEQIPEEPDFIGKRNTSESAAEFAPDRYDDAPLPTQNGEEDTQELVTFDQHAQEGDLEVDGTTPSGAVAAENSTQVTPESAGAEAEQTQDAPDEPVAEGTTMLQTPKLTDDVGTLLLQNTPEQQEQNSPVKIEMAVKPTPESPSTVQQGYYDPSLARHMQRGFRTRERRTRSTGRFVIGRKPSLNVAATPTGRYEEEIYRRIAYFWYRACDDHRGDIIPGSISISLRINTRGQLENMELVRRQGASVSQQSFTFGAIRRASLPPMPLEVQQEVVGDLLELIFQFNFD